MALKQQIPELLNYINSHAAYLEFNKVLFDVYEGELLKYIEADLAEQLSIESYNQAKSRIAPLNLTARITDKLSRIYQQNPTREVDGPDSDKELLSWYEDKLNFNAKMNGSNEFFNLFRSTLIQHYVRDNAPQMRAIPNHQFLVYSNDPIDPTIPTHTIIIHHKESREVKVNNVVSMEEVIIYHAYTDDEFLIFNSKEEIEHRAMEEAGNPEGINPVGKMPFTNINKSANLLIPKADQDGFRMSKIVPILMSDLNYSVMFQAFSIIYGIDLDTEGLAMAPNSLWTFTSNENSDKTPQLGTIKPSVEINSVIGLIQAELSMYLETKGITPGAMGQLTGDNVNASGIAKIIDEADTVEDRQKQTVYFGEGEKAFWDLQLNHLHPFWVSQGLIENRTIFSQSSKVMTNFAEQIPMVKRGDIVEDLEKEVQAGFTTKKRAIKKLNPHMTEQEIDELMGEIEEEQVSVVEVEEEPEVNPEEDE